MKNLKLLSILLFSVLSFSLASCGDDDDEIGGRDTLVGTWQCTWSEGYYRNVNHPEDDEEWNEEASGEDSFTVTFKADGTGVFDGDVSKWKLEGNQLYIADMDTNDEWDVSTVLKLTDSELIVESYEKNDESGSEYYDKYTFKKM